MVKESPHTARAKELYDTNGPRIDASMKPIPTPIRPGHLSDGQPRTGVKPETVHHDKGRPYDHPHGHAYREDLRERPSAKPLRSFAKR
jgi:hypothetical protein